MDYVNVDTDQIYNFHSSLKHYSINKNNHDLTKLANSCKNNDDSQTYSITKNKTMNIQSNIQNVSYMSKKNVSYMSKNMANNSKISVNKSQLTKSKDKMNNKSKFVPAGMQN